MYPVQLNLLEILTPPMACIADQNAPKMLIEDHFQGAPAIGACHGFFLNIEPAFMMPLLTGVLDFTASMIWWRMFPMFG